MSEKSRPASDVSNNGWTSAPVYSKMNELAPDDCSYVQSGGDPNEDVFVVALSPMQWPKPGQQKLTVRLRMNGSPTTEVVVLVELLQGTNVIASTEQKNPGGSFHDVTLILSDAMIAGITSYTDFRVRVSALGPVTVPCCPDHPVSRPGGTQRR